jgi:hypothetical protein
VIVNVATRRPSSLPGAVVGPTIENVPVRVWRRILLETLTRRDVVDHHAESNTHGVLELPGDGQPLRKRSSSVSMSGLKILISNSRRDDLFSLSSSPTDTDPSHSLNKFRCFCLAHFKWQFAATSSLSSTKSLATDILFCFSAP